MTRTETWLPPYQRAVGIVFLLAWFVAAIHPISRGTWLVENILVCAAIFTVVVASRYVRISNVSFTLIALFLTLHVIGSHWTYVGVPFGWTLGKMLGTTRNMYDRVVHFAFGLLFAYPIREVFVRMTGTRGFWTYSLPFNFILSFSAVFEIFEWLLAVSVNGSVSSSFYGAQGDPWDTPEDMACAAVGALIALGVIFILRNVQSRRSARHAKGLLD